MKLFDKQKYLYYNKKKVSINMTKREVMSVIFLSVFTCGIYAIYWYYVTAEELNRVEPNEPITNYILAIVFGIFSCGLYLIYWHYKFYKKIDVVTGETNMIINFVLSLLGLSIVSQAIVQSSINNKR